MTYQDLLALQSRVAEQGEQIEALQLQLKIVLAMLSPDEPAPSAEPPAVQPMPEEPEEPQIIYDFAEINFPI